VVYQEGGKGQKIKEQYIGGLLMGAMQIIDVPDARQIAIYSQIVYNNTPYSKSRR